jgi:hypothetical protein
LQAGEGGRSALPFPAQGPAPLGMGLGVGGSR